MARVSWDADWQATKIYLRGWGVFEDKDNTGLTSQEALKLGHQVVGLLPQPLRTRVSNIYAPYGKNKQIAVAVTGGTESCWTIRNELAQKLLATPVVANGKPVYCVVENPPWKIEKNKTLNRLRQAFKRFMPANVYGNLDFRSNECAVATDKSSDALYLARLTKKQSWKWYDSEILRLCPGINLAQLKGEASSDQE